MKEIDIKASLKMYFVLSAFVILRSYCKCIPDPSHQQINSNGAEDACSKAGKRLTSEHIE